MYAVGCTKLLCSLFSDYKSSYNFIFFLAHSKDLFLQFIHVIAGKNLIYCSNRILLIRCHGSQIFKRNAFTYKVMFSYHSLIEHIILLLSEKINNNLAIWNVSGMFGEVDGMQSQQTHHFIYSGNQSIANMLLYKPRRGGSRK